MGGILPGDLGGYLLGKGGRGPGMELDASLGVHKSSIASAAFEVESMEMVGKIMAFLRWFSQLSCPIAGGHAHIYP